MDFKKERCYTSLNADELKVGSKVFVADSLDELKDIVTKSCKPLELKKVLNTNSTDRFVVSSNTAFNLAYFVSEPEEKKLKWTDLKIGDIIRKKYEDGYRSAMVIRIDTYSTERHIGLGGEWLTDDSLEDWKKVEGTND